MYLEIYIDTPLKNVLLKIFGEIGEYKVSSGLRPVKFPKLSGKLFQIHMTVCFTVVMLVKQLSSCSHLAVYRYFMTM